MSGTEANTATHEVMDTSSTAAAPDSTPTGGAEAPSSTSADNIEAQTTIDAATSTSTTAAGDPGSKKCTMCQKPRNVLIRCQIDDTGKWHFLCPGKCWRSVSDDGTVDGGKNAHNLSRKVGHTGYYKYGGTWKNKHQMVSGKIKGKAKRENQVPTTRAQPDGDVPEELKKKEKHTARAIWRPDMRTGKGTRNNNKETGDWILRQVDVRDLDEEQDITSQLGNSEDDEEQSGYEEHEGEYEYHEESGNKSDKRTIEQDGVSIDFENRPLQSDNDI